MLDQICAEIRNYFSFEDDKFIGDFEIIDGNITPPIPIVENQYYRIVGSVFNDGVHKYGDATDVLIDEAEFHGAVWLMRVPQDLIDLAQEIEDWQNKNADVLTSPFTSESFGGYSYTKASGTGSATGNAYDWKQAFASRLNRYRKIRTI